MDYKGADLGVDVRGLDGGVEVLGGEGDALHGRGAAPLGGLVELLAHPLPLPLLLGQRVRPAHQRRRRPPRRRGAAARRAGERRAREARDVLRQGGHPLSLGAWVPACPVCSGERGNGLALCYPTGGV